MILPRSSRTVDHAPAKRRVTAWQALVWAYADECVRAAGGDLSLSQDYSLGGGTARVMSALDNLHSATVRGFLQVHEDAVQIDAIMRTAMFRRGKDGARDDAQYLLVVKAAESRKPVPQTVELPARIPLPIYHNTGAQFPKPKVEIHPINRRPLFCPIEWTGYPPDEAERIQGLQRRRFEMFLAALDYLNGVELATRRIEGRGLDNLGRVLTPCDESLTQGSTLSALRPEG